MRIEVPHSALSFALLVFSGIWFLSAYQYYATSHFRLDWSSTPLPWMCLAVLTPSICFCICIILADHARRARLSQLDMGALVVGFCPITLGSVLAFWAVRGLLQMGHAGI